MPIYLFDEDGEEGCKRFVVPFFSFFAFSGSFRLSNPLLACVVVVGFGVSMGGYTGVQGQLHAATGSRFVSKNVKAGHHSIYCKKDKTS